MIDVTHGEVDLRLLRHGQQVKDRIRRATHGDVESHGILEGLKRCDRPRQYGTVTTAVILLRHFDDAFASRLEERPAQFVCRQDRAIAWQRQADGFVETVHAIGRKHP